MIDCRRNAFSLVELSIVLVILGLLVGGVLSGKSLIHAAEIKSTIGQVDSIKVASRAFRDKYFYLPGDLPTADATRLNFGQNDWGAGNGNGVIDRGSSQSFAAGEGNLFFVHAAQAGMLAGNYIVLRNNQDTQTNGRQVSEYIPQAKLGGGNFYLYTWYGGPDPSHPGGTSWGNDGINYISLANVHRYCSYNDCGTWGGNGTLPTIDAFNIDSKVDDGKPQSGHVQAFYLQYNRAGEWAGAEYGGGIPAGMHTFNSPLPSTAANAASALNCYDNGGSAGTAQSYTVSRDNNTCALSFKM